MTEILTSFTGDWPPYFREVAFVGVIALVVLLRYFLFTGVAFGMGELIGRFAPARRIQPLPFTGKQIRREILDSMVSVLIFTLVGVVLVFMIQAGWTQFYTNADAYGTVWFWLQIPVALLINDYYFYWMHRAVHHPTLFARVHRTHHLSTNPTAFAAFAFHPIEAVLEIAIVIVIVAVIPMHTVGLTIYALLALAYNVYGHLGYEIMPRFIGKSRIGRLLNTAAYHNQHHKTFRYNYGLYTTIWDRLHGTLHPEAENLYDRATSGTVITQKGEVPEARWRMDET